VCDRRSVGLDDRTHWVCHGFVALDRGEPDRAASLFANAATMFRECADRYFEFGTLEGLGQAHLLAGHIDESAR
jgi:hypothetical protein